MKGFKPDEIEKNTKKVSNQKLEQKFDLKGQRERNSNDPQDDTFEITKFQFYKPTFFALIEERFMKYT